MRPSGAGTWLTATALAVIAGVLLTACQDGPAETGEQADGTPTDPASGSWGPLAVVANSTGAEALIHGVVEITDSCVLLVEEGSAVLVLWTAPDVRWLAERNAFTVSVEGTEEVTIEDGDVVALSGGGTSEEEDSGASVTWVATPDPECSAPATWHVNRVISVEGSEDE